MYEFVATISKDDKKPTPKKYYKSDIIYKTNYIFNKYHETKKIEILSLESKCSFLERFSNDLDKFRTLKLQKKKKDKKR